MQPHGNILCLEYSELVPSIMSKDTYDISKRRGNITVYGRGGNGRFVLVSYESLPAKYQQKVLELYGCPQTYYANQILLNGVQPNAAAAAYYRSFTYTDKKANEHHLPEAAIEACTEAASWADMVLKYAIADTSTHLLKQIGMSKPQFWAACSRLVQAKNINLPTAYPKLLAKVKEYEKTGYDALISGKYGNNNSQKLTEEHIEWLVAHYSCHHPRITDMAHLTQVFVATHELPITEARIHQVMSQPAVRQLWYGARYGEKVHKEQYGVQHVGYLPTAPNAHWYSDATKVNYYYQGEKGIAAKLQVTLVMDVATECFIGWDFDTTETNNNIYQAYRMALMAAMVQPQVIQYDNGAANKKLEKAGFFARIGKVGCATRAYNGKSKTIENAFGRWQSKFLKQDWFFTGMNNQARSQESKVNEEFILANTHNLPSREEVIATCTQRIHDWNNAQKGNENQSRLYQYQHLPNTETKAIDYSELVQIIGLYTKDPAEYRAEGLKVTINKRKMHYIVYDAQQMPDMAFRNNYIGKKLFTQYDPADLSTVWLYETTSKGDLRLVAMAQDAIRTARFASVYGKVGEAERVQAINDLQNQERIDRQAQIEAIQLAYGTHASQHGLVYPHIAGLQTKKGKLKDTHAEWLKAESLADHIVDAKDMVEEPDAQYVLVTTPEPTPKSRKSLFDRF